MHSGTGEHELKETRGYLTTCSAGTRSHGILASSRSCACVACACRCTRGKEEQKKGTRRTAEILFRLSCARSNARSCVCIYVCLKPLYIPVLISCFFVYIGALLRCPFPSLAYESLTCFFSFLAYSLVRRFFMLFVEIPRVTRLFVLYIQDVSKNLKR